MSQVGSNFGGRKLADEWSHVMLTPAKNEAVCRYCSKPVSKKIERIRKHLLTCQSYKSRNNGEIEDVQDDEEDELIFLDSSTPENPDVAEFNFRMNFIKIYRIKEYFFYSFFF